MDEIQKQTEVKNISSKNSRFMPLLNGWQTTRKVSPGIWQVGYHIYLCWTFHFNNKTFSNLRCLETDIELKCFSLIKTKKDYVTWSFSQNLKYDPTAISEKAGVIKRRLLLEKRIILLGSTDRRRKVATGIFSLKITGRMKIYTFPMLSPRHEALKALFDDVSMKTRHYFKGFNGRNQIYLCGLSLKNNVKQPIWQCRAIHQIL